MKRKKQKANPVVSQRHDGTPLEIKYGHNVSVNQLIMVFNAPINNMVLSPEEAEHMIRCLQEHIGALRAATTVKK